MIRCEYLDAENAVEETVFLPANGQISDYSDHKETRYKLTFLDNGSVEISRYVRVGGYVEGSEVVTTLENGDSCLLEVLSRDHRLIRARYTNIGDGPRDTKLGAQDREVKVDNKPITGTAGFFIRV